MIYHFEIYKVLLNMFFIYLQSHPIQVSSSLQILLSVNTQQMVNLNNYKTYIVI
jgi:hypothetical protein